MSPTVKPIRLRADNFTPPTRTPWGGKRIRRHYKSGLGLPPSEEVVGESWEISVEPSFPSALHDDSSTLAEVIAQAPETWLGASNAERYGGQTPLLVKLLDAAENLSVQVHPSDDDPALVAGESGKPEAWIILQAQPGARLYLGFRDGVDRAAVEDCIAGSGSLDDLMNTVPVESGDAFVIAPGTAHAIGAGITLLEPQFVRPGRRGLTYRFWDWNRRYDAAGCLDVNGRARELHLERSLAVTAWGGPSGADFVESCRVQARVIESGSLQREQVIDWPWFHVERWQGAGVLSVPARDTMIGICCVGGKLTLNCDLGPLELRCGESGVVPAAAGALDVVGEDVLAFTVRCPSVG